MLQNDIMKDFEKKEKLEREKRIDELMDEYRREQKKLDDVKKRYHDEYKKI